MIPSIYPPFMLAYIPAPWIRHGDGTWRNKKPGKKPVQWNVWLMNIELEHLGYGLERNYQRMDWFVGVENLICWSCTDFHGKIEHLAFWFSENIRYDCWAYIEHFEKNKMLYPAGSTSVSCMQTPRFFMFLQGLGDFGSFLVTPPLASTRNQSSSKPSPSQGA